MQVDLTASLPGAEARDSATLAENVGIYLELAKARLGALVVLTTIAGFVLAARGHGSLWTLALTVIGTALTAFGANILNQVWEVERDRKMDRTRTRPLPAGRISRRRATIWGLVSSVLGLAVLALGANLLTSGLALLVILLYVLVYTPMKVRTPFNTVVGAVCGAVPPVMGWTAATGQLHGGAWILGGILFVWQIPHFLALAWLYREDYARGGFRMLPSVDPEGRLSGRIALLYTASLLPISALVSLSGVSGTTFLVGSQFLGIGFFALGWLFLNRRTEVAARRLFLASIVYLPLVLGLMVTDMDDRIARGAFLGADPKPVSAVEVADQRAPAPSAAVEVEVHSPSS